MSAAKDLRAFARELQGQGWSRRQAKSGHVHLVPPGGGRPLILSVSPSRPNAVRRARADLRKLRGGSRR